MRQRHDEIKEEFVRVEVTFSTVLLPFGYVGMNRSRINE